MGNPGLSAEEVRRMTADWRTDEPSESEPQSARNYREGEDWHRNKRKMQNNEQLIYALALKGYSQEQIAAVFHVSRECVARRLRPLGVLRKKGRPALGEEPTIPAPIRRAAILLMDFNI